VYPNFDPLGNPIPGRTPLQYAFGSVRPKWYDQTSFKEGERRVIIVPMEELSEQVLGALIEEFVTRNGAIQGEDAALEVKVAQVRRMLKSGKAVIVWDDESESATILTKEEYKKAEAGGPGRVVEEDEGWRPRGEDEG
jgi:uncharacterized protein YheU (UPF0270 family)